MLSLHEICAVFILNLHELSTVRRLTLISLIARIFNFLYYICNERADDSRLGILGEISNKHCRKRSTWKLWCLLLPKNNQGLWSLPFSRKHAQIGNSLCERLWLWSADHAQETVQQAWPRRAEELLQGFLPDLIIGRLTFGGVSSWQFSRTQIFKGDIKNDEEPDQTRPQICLSSGFFEYQEVIKKNNILHNKIEGIPTKTGQSEWGHLLRCWKDNVRLEDFPFYWDANSEPIWKISSKVCLWRYYEGTKFHEKTIQFIKQPKKLPLHVHQRYQN